MEPSGYNFQRYYPFQKDTNKPRWSRNEKLKLLRTEQRGIHPPEFLAELNQFAVSVNTQSTVTSGPRVQFFFIQGLLEIILRSASLRLP